MAIFNTFYKNGFQNDPLNYWRE